MLLWSHHHNMIPVWGDRCQCWISAWASCSHTCQMNTSHAKFKIHQKNLLRAQFMTNKQQRCKRPHRHPSSLRWCLASIDGTPRWALSGTLFHGGINPLLAGLIWPRQGLLWTQVCPWTHHGRRGPPRPLRCFEPADVLGGPTVCGSAAPFSNYSYCQIA